MQNSLSLTIEGMHCAACIRRVTTALQSVSGVGVDAVKVGSAQLTFDPSQAAAQEIIAAIERIGFSAQIQQ